MVECHQFLGDNIGFRMKNKIPAAPPGTHGVIFYKFCQLLTAAVLALPAWSFVSPLSAVSRHLRLMKPPGDVRHWNTSSAHSLHRPGQASS